MQKQINPKPIATYEPAKSAVKNANDNSPWY